MEGVTAALKMGTCANLAELVVCKANTPEQNLRGNSSFCFLLLSGISLTVTKVLAVAMTLAV